MKIHVVLFKITKKQPTFFQETLFFSNLIPNATFYTNILFAIFIRIFLFLKFCMISATDPIPVGPVICSINIPGGRLFYLTFSFE